jgi:hypothetical protein
VNHPGWIYTIHLETPLGSGGRNGARHYTGWAHDGGLLARLEAHRRGAGSAMLACAYRRGVRWHVGALRIGNRIQERRLKRSHGADRWCWTCQAVRP